MEEEHKQWRGPTADEMAIAIAVLGDFANVFLVILVFFK
jgi:hypothetical protein